MTDDTQATSAAESLNATLPLPTEAAPEPAPALSPAPVPSPVVRWAGVVWGLLFCAFGVAVIGVLSTSANRIAFSSWVQGLGPAGAGLVAVVAVGVLVLVLGVLGAVGRAQRR